MDWRVLMRRCPTRSLTAVGDLAQRESRAGATSWGAMLDPYVPGRWAYRRLTVNYRTPAEIMAVAARVLALVDPALRAPASVRDAGAEPWARRVPPAALGDAVRAAAAELTPAEGTFAVIAPAGVDAGVPALTPRTAKGLEFDAVLVVQPDRILAADRGAADLYVSLTRATQRLGIVHTGPLPSVLSGLSDARLSRAG
jgi:DNA helicase IV